MSEMLPQFGGTHRIHFVLKDHSAKIPMNRLVRRILYREQSASRVNPLN